MAKESSAQDPLEFVRNMWSNMGFSLPGMITPTLDVDELDKRIGDLKAVEHWLKMNLNALQMTTQGLEMQRATLAAIKAMSEQAREAGERHSAQQGRAAEQAQPTDENPFAAAAAMWPWNLMSGQAVPTPEGNLEAKSQTTSEKASKPPAAEKPRAKPVRKPPSKSSTS